MTSANDSRVLLWTPRIRLRESELDRPEGWLAQGDGASQLGNADGRVDGKEHEWKPPDLSLATHILSEGSQFPPAAIRVRSAGLTAALDPTLLVGAATQSSRPSGAA